MRREPSVIAFAYSILVSSLIILAKDWERLHTILNFHLNRLVNQERALLSKYPDLFERENVEVRREPDELGVDFLVETKLKYHA